MIDSKKNIYDYGLIILITLLVFGEIGGNMQPIRILALLLFPLTVSFFFQYQKNKQIRSIYQFVLFLFSYIFLSIFWTSNIDEGFKEVVYYIAHFSLFLLIPIFYVKAKNSFKTLIRGWFVFILLSQIVAFNEIIFDNHLSISFFSSDFMINIGGAGVQKKFASVTFGNYNTYVMVLTMALPFLFGHLYVYRRLRTQLLSIMVICFSYFILLINASRGGIIASVIILLVFILMSKKKKISNLKTKVFFFMPVLFFLLYKYYAVIFEQVFYRTYGSLSFSEDEQRLELINKALQAFYKKPFFGGGVGSLQTEMQGAQILVPHNLLLEFLVQYGFLISLVFILYLIKIFRKSRKADYLSKMIIYSAFFSLPVISIINSGYLLHPVFWVFLSSLYCVSFLKIQNSFSYE